MVGQFNRASLRVDVGFAEMIFVIRVARPDPNIVAKSSWRRVDLVDKLAVLCSFLVQLMRTNLRNDIVMFFNLALTLRQISDLRKFRQSLVLVYGFGTFLTILQLFDYPLDFLSRHKVVASLDLIF